MSRVLRGTIHVPNGDGSITSVLGGTSEADAKKQAPEAFAKWGDHVWVDADVPPAPSLPFTGDIDDDAGDDGDGDGDGSSSHRTRRRGNQGAGA